MTDAGFFKGTSAEQDARFSDKKKKLMKTMKFGDNLSQKVDMTRVNLECIKPWIIKRITELLNFEDEVVWDYVMNQLEERYPDPRDIQINITGFLNSKNARIFLSELWDLLISAMQNPDGVPTTLVEAKKAEIANRQLDERQVQMELRRKQEELKIKAAAAQVPSAANTAVQQGNLTVRPLPNGSNNETAGTVPRTMQSTDGKALRSPSASPAREIGNGNAKIASEKANEDSKRHRKTKHRHRSRSMSTSSYSSVESDDREGRHSRHRRRSRAIEVVAKKPVAPESDWRKDLMAGRRRSPPPMPENSYYGYEKRHREHKHSRHRRRSSGSEGDYRRSRHSHSRDSRRRGDSPPRRSREHSPKDYRHYDRRSGKHEYPESPEDPSYRYRDKRRRRESRSPSPSSPKLAGHVYATPADRANRLHDRRAQWAQEEDDLRTYETRETSGKQLRQKVSVEADRRLQRADERVSSRTPEGPSPPQSLKEKLVKRKQQPPSDKPQSPSASSDSESESSSDDDDSSSGSGSSSSESEDGDARVPEGPSPPPSTKKPVAEPEGPALPPTLANTPMKPSVPQAASASSSDASGSDSDSNDDESGSSSGSESGSSSSGSEESSDTSSGTEDKQDAKHKGPSPPKRKRTEKDSKPSHTDSKRRERLPEGPALPSSYISEPKVQRKISDHAVRESSERQQRKPKREDSAEDALRRRALASLMQAAGKRHRRSSRSP